MAAIIVIEGEFWTSETGHSVSKSGNLFGFSNGFHYFTFRTAPIHLIYLVLFLIVFGKLICLNK